jgi:hypothetical protein
MPNGKCDVCGKASILHMTEAFVGLSEEKQHWYCMDHVPDDLKARMPAENREESKPPKQRPPGDPD